MAQVQCRKSRMWKCKHCSLHNYYITDICQACFRKELSIRNDIDTHFEINHITHCVIEEFSSLSEQTAILLHDQWPGLCTVSARSKWYQNLCLERNSKQVLNSDYKNPTLPYFLVLIDQFDDGLIVVGHCCLPSAMKLENAGNCITCTELVINPLYRKKGLGKVLVEYYLKFCKDLGYDWCYGYTTSTLIEKFYYQFGFEKVSDFDQSDTQNIWLRQKLQQLP